MVSMNFCAMSAHVSWMVLLRARDRMLVCSLVVMAKMSLSLRVA